MGNVIYTAINFTGFAKMRYTHYAALIPVPATERGGVLHVIIKFIELILSVEAIIISYYICKRLDRQNKGG